jgi:outer membrane protein assembly factor BamA
LQPRTISADVVVTGLALRAGEARLQLEDAATARYSASTLSVAGLRLRTGATTLDVTGAIGPPTATGLSLSLNGRLGDLEPWIAASALPEGLDIDGSIAAFARATGSLERMSVTGDARLSAGRVAWPGYPAFADVAAEITLSDEVISVPGLHARWQDTTFDGSFRAPLAFARDALPAAIASALAEPAGMATLDARVTNLTPATLASLAGTAPDETFTGRADLRLDLQASAPTIDGVSGSLVVSDLALTAAGLPVEQVEPTRLDVSNGSVEVASWSWNIAGSQLAITGRADLAGARAVDLLVDGRLDLRVLAAFLPTVRTGGTGDMSVAVHGTVDSPVADGTIRVTDGELRLSDPPLGVTGVRGLLDLQPNRIDITRIEGALNGGAFTIAGGLDYSGFNLTGGSVSIDADAVAFNVPRGMRTAVNAQLTATADDRIRVTGRVDIVRGAYREPLSLAASFAAIARQREAARATVAGSAPSVAERVDLDVAVASSADLVIDNNYGRMDLGIDLRVVGTAAAPSVVGRATIREGGELFLGGQTYVVERGLIDFSDPRAIVPELDILARTRVSGTNDVGGPADYDITLSLTGTTDTLTTTLTSDPTRSQADIVSLLATGRLADQVGGIGGSVARDQILGYLSGEALGFAARAVGLDSIRFERSFGQEQALQSDPSIAGEVNPAQRLTISRRLSRSVEVTLSQNLRDTGLLTWVVAYTPVRPLEVRAISRDDRNRSYELRHDVSLGGPAEPRIARTSSRAGRIAAVRITGDSVLPVADVERVLALGTGDRFDFYRWQRDRDRLRRLYLDRGYREVRIAARQRRGASSAAEPEAPVTIEYDITAGPLTVLEIDGYRFSGATLRQLEQVWNDSIVDVTLTDELAETARRSLGADGYLQAAVRAERVGSDDTGRTKRIRIQVVPGPRSVERRLELTGNSLLRDAEIGAIAEHLGIDAWFAPKSLADEIALRYRQAGRLSASVAAGPVEYAGSAAVMPVRIDEGPPFSIGRVVVRGAHERSEHDARGDMALTEGAPYVPDAVEAARAALRRGYARAGFNAMSARFETAVDANSNTVQVTVEIAEGPRQLLQEVAISGGAGISTGTIAGALALETGEPVDIDAWYASRRRLLQTGLFRRVEIEPATVEPARAPGDVEYVRADVTLVRRQPWRLRYGIDVTDENAPVAEQGRVLGGGLNANIERFGLFGGPGSGSASLRYNRNQRVARGGVTWPTMFGRPVASRLYLSRSRNSVQGEDILSFVTDRITVTAEQRMPLGRRTLLAWAYQFERNHVFEREPDPDNPFAIDERWQQARLATSLVVDTRTDPFTPERGQLHSSNVEYGLEVLGRTGRFLKYSLQQFVFVPIVPGVVSASGVRLNVGRGFGGDLILSERFYAGGTNTVRGYEEYSLGGVDFFGDPIPGQAAVVFNQEVRFPLYRWLRGVGFVDAGDVFARTTDVSLRALKFGTGGGLRFATPVGLFRLDLATPVPRQGRPLQWYFAFGHIF